SELDLDLYYQMKNESGIDIFNPNDTAFTTRCYIHSEDLDTTVNYRRSNYYANTTIKCNPGCEYNGLDEDGYIDCKCLNAKTEYNIVNQVVNNFLDSYSD